MTVTPLKTLLTLITLLLVVFAGEVRAQEQATYTAPGTATFTVPEGVTQITVQLWGAGGGGQNGNAGGGGGAGAFAQSTLSVTPGDVLNFSIGQGGTEGNAGSSTWFASESTVFAPGGLSVNGTGGSAASAIGTIRWSGGSGGNGHGRQAAGNRGGGGGGGSPTPTADGGDGGDGGNNVQGVGGTGQATGGIGGRGATNGGNGGAPGAGGGGSGNNSSGGTGGNGQVVISWSPPSAANSTITASPEEDVVADGSDSSTLTITVRDEDDEVMGADVELFFEITSGTGTLSAGPWTSNSSGQATATLTSTTAGTVVVTGYLGTDNTGEVLGTASIVFTPLQIRVETASDGSGAVVAAQDVVSGDAITVWAVARDASDNFVELVTDASWSLQNLTGGVVAGDLTDNANGSATFTGALTGSATIRAASGALTPTESGTITVIPGAPDQLVFDQQPGTTEAGESIDPPVTVQILDAAGNLVSGDNTTEVSIAIGTNPSSGTLSGTSPVTASGGVATFSDLSIDEPGTGYTLQASSGALTLATSSAFEITATAPDEFTITGTITDGTDPLEGVSVAATGGHTQTVSTDASGVYTLTGVTEGSQNITITPTLTSYTFDPSSRSVAGPVNDDVTGQDFTGTEITYTLTVNVTGDGSVEVNGTPYTTPITVSSGTTLTLQAVPDSGWELDGWSGDLSGNQLTETLLMDEDKEVTATFTLLPPSDVTLVQQVLGTAAGDVNQATFATTPVEGNLLVATTSFRDGPNAATSPVSPGSGWVLRATDTFVSATNEWERRGIAVWTKVAEPSEPTTITTSWDPARDDYLIIQEFSASNAIFGPFTGAVTANNGLDYENSIASGDISNSNSGDFFVFGALYTHGAASSIGWTNGIGSTTILNAGDWAFGTGYGKVTTSGNLSTTATPDDFRQMNLALIAIQLIPPPTQIRVETEPDGSGIVVPAQDVSSGNDITVYAIARDASNNFVELVESATWSLQNITGGVVAGDLVDNEDGSATFTGALSGTATIRATSGALTPTESGTITVVSDTPTQLEFGQQPTNTGSASTITPAVTVRLLDAQGDLVESATNNVTIVIADDPTSGEAVLSGTLTVAAVDGVALFSDLSIDLIGTGYTLEATSGALTSATSDAFNITVGGADADQTTISANPTSIAADGTSTSTITVQVKDAGGNNLSSGGATVTLSSTTGSLGSVTDNSDGTYTATLTAPASPSTATITGTLNSTAIGDQAIVTFVNAGVDANQTTISASPTSIAADGSSTSTITVQARNSSGDTITGGGDIVTLSTTAGSLGSVTDNGDGTYSATLTSSESVELATITGTINGDAIGDQATVSFTIGSALLRGLGGNLNTINVSGDDYIVHVFTQTGTSTFTPPPGVTEVEVLVVGGGGGGGTSRQFTSAGSGGGGAGGLVFDESFSVSGDVTVVVGAGGAGGIGAGDTHEFGANGENSSFGGLTALGGGGGAGGNAQGAAGGSGGGSRGTSGGLGEQPGSASGGFGTNGGNSGGSPTGAAATGGGGAGSAAENLSGTAGEQGGQVESDSSTTLPDPQSITPEAAVAELHRI